MLNVTKANSNEIQKRTSQIPGIWGMGLVLAFLALWAVHRNFMAENRLDYHVSIFVWPVDFQVYFEAVANLHLGRELYAHNWVGTLPFTYPPFAAVVMKVFLLTDFYAAAIMWQSASALVLAAVIIACFRRLGYSWGPGILVLAALGFFASFNLNSVQGTFFYGQINIFLLGLVAWDFLGEPTRKTRGIGTGLAAGLKLTPAFHGILFLLEKKWWASVISFAVFLLTVGIGFLFVPDAGDFWTGKITETDRIGEQLNPGALSLRAVLVRLGVSHETLVWIICVAVVLALFYVAGRAALRRNNYVMAIGLSGTVAVLVSPFSWYHHWVFSVPLALALLDGLRRIFTDLLARWFDGKLLWCVQQVAGAVAGILTLLAFLPQSAMVTMARMHFFFLSQSSHWYMRDLQVFTTIILLVVITGYYWWSDRTKKAS